ncbi:ABC transporter permease [Rubrivivax gelatinosus]|uniref:Transport permease protein n=1 Tax=Rubrivivax gelatinosus TaxID=28068 RepID=A0ABS1E0H7_RUBGE|nr:ABC transporter permease [Rubrivivax gelatinosus]MBK1714392.1 ABC transporter [Rubrivivax gelatinosus]
MSAPSQSLFAHRDLIATLAWKNVVVRYKQAYLGLAWTVAKPLMMMLIFTLMRGFIGIDSGGVPYPVLAYCALMPWMFFQESASEGVNSVVGNAHLIKKVYFPRAIFPLTAVVTKLVEFGVNFVILLALMLWFGMLPGVQALWVPLLVLYTVCAALALALLGAAINVHFRDVGQMLPVLLTLLMYVSPVIYPLALVERRLLVEHAGGAWSEWLYRLYTANPLAGIIDGFQRVLLLDQPPDLQAMLPGIVVVAVCLPLSYAVFKRAERHFADVI